MTNELLEIIVSTRTDAAGLLIPSLIFINDGLEGPTAYIVDRVIRRDNEIIDGVKTIAYTCLVDVDSKKESFYISNYTSII
ncbi:MAG TPA: hypothetical protein DGK91_13460 [Clostridium sp.]|jgi:hypothetical protein|nr:hypothetical protein [Clostridium sp.]